MSDTEGRETAVDRARTPQHEPEPEVPQKRRAEVTKDSASKKRNARMFGVMMGTLNKFKAEGSKIAESQKTRRQIDDKLQKELRRSTLEAEKKQERQRQDRQLKSDILRKTDERHLIEALYRRRHGTAANLANYLCTKQVGIPDQDASSAASRPEVYPKLPQHLYPAPTNPPIYYKPFRLLPEQQKVIDEQIEKVQAAIDRDREDLNDEIRDRKKELDDLTRKKEEAAEALEREERAERAAREREARDAEDGGPRSAGLSINGAAKRAALGADPLTTDGDADMEGTRVTVNEEEMVEE